LYPGPKTPGQKSVTSIGNGLHWRDVDEFTLLQAACLWAGIEPLDSFQDLRCSPEATARYQMLTRAVESGGLDARHPAPAPRTIRLAAAGQHAPEMLVSRSELEEFASSIGELPLFLSPATLSKRRRRKRDPQTKLNVTRKHRAVWAEAVAKWPNNQTRPPARQMAKELCKDTGRHKGTGYTEETVRKILRRPRPDFGADG
jgi:hypothetical protein